MDDVRQHPGDLQRAPDPTRSSYWSEIHVEMVSMLVVLFLVLLVVGWSLRPSSSGYPRVPHGWMIVVSDSMQPLTHATVTVALTRNADNSAVLTVDGGPLDPGQLTVISPGGFHICQPHRGYMSDPYSPDLLTSHLPYPRLQKVSDTQNNGVTKMELRSYGGIYFRLCWTVNAPVSLDGPYLSASLPTVEIPLTETTDQTTDLGARVRMVLAPDAGDTSYYSLQATPSPSEAASNSWTWSETGSNVQTETFGTPAVATPPIYVAAVNAGGTQQDTVRAFFAGVLLGIAGAALVTIAQELISPLSRRRDARHPV